MLDTRPNMFWLSIFCPILEQYSTYSLEMHLKNDK